MAYSSSVTGGVTLDRDNFRNPPLEMGIVPFWFWNGKLEHDELEWQLREYYDRGVRSLFIHGRMGLKVPYLSDSWFERVQFVVQKAKEIGIDAWVYDEMDWPSGTAGKQVMKADPELQQRYLELVPLYFQGPLFTFLEAHDDRYVNTGNSNPIAAYGVSQREYESTIHELIDLNKNLAWEKTIPWEAPAGDWVLLYFLEKTDPHYIDTLNPASTEKFLQLTHDRYKAAVGEEFGKTVPGFFTDEPAMYYYHVGLKNHVIPWSKHMFKIFRDRRGYDLKPHLPALYRNVGPRTAEIRYDFWRTLTEQYTETYYKRIRDWCEANGVVFTGHLLFEEYLRLAARCEGNIFKYLQQMHMIGVDHLYPIVGTREDPSQHVALKLASSAAHHFGSARLLCESMGGTYWDCTLERMKWINNWEYVLGVNLFNNHGYHYTIEGERKRDWPPSQFYHHTWWKYYDRFTTYNARISHLLTGGRHVAKLLMLYPINSIWCNYMPQEQTRVSEVIESDFQYLTDTLLRLHYDFDYVDEDVLAGAEIEGGKIRIGEETYDVFVMPPTTHVKESTYLKLRQFLQSGGCLITDTLVPVALLDCKDEFGDGYAPLDRGFFGIDGAQVLETFERREKEPFDLVHLKADGKHFFFKGDGLASKKERAGEMGRDSREKTLRRVLHECMEPDVIISHEDVFYLHRVKDGFDVYFLANTTQKDLGRVTVSFERLGRPELWNTTSGEMRPLANYRVEEGRLTVELDFPPSESHVIVLQGEVAEVHVPHTNLLDVTVEDDRITGFHVGGAEVYADVHARGEQVRVTAPARETQTPIELPVEYAFDVEQPNVLVVERWKMAMEQEAAAGEYWAVDYDDSAWLDVTNGAWEMQLPHEREEATYPVTVWYRTSFEADYLPDDLRILIDGFSGRDFSLYLNGTRVDSEGRRCWLDAEIREVDIRPYAQTGTNRVAVRIEVGRRTDGILDLLKIVGRFGVVNDRIVAPPDRIRLGDWTGQGYPYFSGTGVYRTRVEVPADWIENGRVYFEADCGEDVLEVSINGGDGRVAPWHPYRIDVTPDLRAGSNDFEIRVTNTLLNILEGVKHPSGLFNPPRLVFEHRYAIEVPVLASPVA
ncbi:MAG TPA: glycosyl hydrolase [Rhodothermales bacterium]